MCKFITLCNIELRPQINLYLISWAYICNKCGIVFADHLTTYRNDDLTTTTDDILGILEMHDALKADKSKDSTAKQWQVMVVKLLKMLFALACIYTLYFAQSLLLPLIFSALVALLLSPLVTKLKKLYVPRSISAITLLTVLITPLVFIGGELSEPIERWMKLVPQLSEEVTQQIEEIDEALESQEALIGVNADNADNVDIVGNAKPAAMHQPSESFVQKHSQLPQEIVNEQSIVEHKIKQGSLEIIISLAMATPLILAQVLGSFLLVLFLLIFGPSLFTVFVRDFPIITDKPRAHTLVQNIQQALSKYIVTISMINAGLGFFTGVALWFVGVEDAILWGAIVALFNFVPYVGLIVSFSILTIVGVVQFGFTAGALVPGFVMLIFNIIESQIITPAILGTSMRVNPLIIIIWLLIAGWLWGIIGVLLAVPLFVCIKLAMEKLNVSPHWLNFIEASEDDINI